MALVIGLSLGTSVSAASNYLVREQVADKSATTSLTYMTGGTGTTTLSFATENADIVAYNLMLGSSTTVPTLCSRTQYSMNNVDWFAETEDLNVNATTTNLTRDAKETCWLYASTTPNSSKYTTGTGSATTTYVYIQYKVKDIVASYMRTLFYLPAGSAASNLWVEAVKKVNSY